MLLQPAHIRLVELDFLARLHHGKIGVDGVNQHLLFGDAISRLGKIGLKLAQCGVFLGLATIIQIA